MEKNNLNGMFSSFGKGLCVAIDMRTTSVTCYLCRCVSKDILAVSAFEYSVSCGTGTEIQSDLVLRINSAIEELCDEYSENVKDIKEYFIVGTTAMQQYICGMENSSDSLFGIEERASSLGLCGAADAVAFISPCVAEFLGGGIPAGLFECNEDLADKAELYIDFAEKTCAVMCKSGKYYSVVCDTPVFEGIGITNGKNAFSGAIYSAKITETGDIKYFTKNNIIASGICPTGLVDTVAVKLEKREISDDGKVAEGKNTLIDGISISDDDIALFMKQKKVIYDSILYLSEKSDVPLESVERVVITGSYGSQYSPQSLVRTGCLPSEVFNNNTEIIGNAAGLGAVKALGGNDERDRIIEIADKFRMTEKFLSD